MSDDGNVKNLGPVFVTQCLPPRNVGYHRTGLFYFTKTREYDYPFRFGWGVGIRLPKLLIALGGDGHQWFRLTSRVAILGLWKTTEQRKRWDEDQGLVWALRAVAQEVDHAEISTWVDDEEGVLTEV